MSKNYKPQLIDRYGSDALNSCTGLVSELLALDFITSFAKVERTSRDSQFHEVDMYFSPFKDKFGYESGKTYHCQCKGSLIYHKKNYWSLPFNQTGLGIDRFLNSDFPILITNTHIIPGWSSPFDGKILKVNTKLLKESYDKSNKSSLIIPNDPKYFEVLTDLTDTQKIVLRVLSSSNYTQ